MLDLLQNVNDFFSDISGTVYSITHAFGQIRTFIDTAQTCFNDLDSSFGSKIKDAKLLGFLNILIVGKKFLESGLFEIENRKTSEKEFLNAEQVVEKLISN